jgi:predicted ABC-type sugar transport system permease subunit
MVVCYYVYCSCNNCVKGAAYLLCNGGDFVVYMVVYLMCKGGSIFTVQWWCVTACIVVVITM